MSSLARRAVALVSACLAFGVFGSVAGAALPTGVTEGPAGLDFYTPPESKLSGSHGTVIWARENTGHDVLPSAAANYLVLYRSVTEAGQTVAVSGTVAVPKGKPPKGGWKVLSWGHGTTGVADVCAPSRDTPDSPIHGGVAATNLYLNAWLKRGYAIVESDYQGLGTAGPHAYLIGIPEARSVIDMVPAARAVVPSLAKRWLSFGHSQGGHAVLFTARYAKAWAKGLKYLGTVAFAPASNVAESAKVLRLVKVPSGLSTFIPLILTGVKTVESIDLAAILTDLGLAMYPEAEVLCSGQLGQSDSWGGIAPADAIRSDAPMESVYQVLDRNDPDGLKLKGQQVFVAQGTSDSLVFPSTTAALVKALRQKGAKVTYKTYSGADHSGVLTASYKSASKWVKARFKR